MRSFITLIQASIVLSAEIKHTEMRADDVIAALEKSTLNQEKNIQSTTEKLRALQQRVEAIFPHKQ